MDYINRFQNVLALKVSAGNIYYEDQLMYIFLDNLHQCGKYIAKIEIYQSELRRENFFTDQTCLSIKYLQTDYLNLDRISGYGRNNEIKNLVKKMQYLWRY